MIIFQPRKCNILQLLEVKQKPLLSDVCVRGFEQNGLYAVSKNRMLHRITLSTGLKDVDIKIQLSWFETNFDLITIIITKLILHVLLGVGRDDRGLTGDEKYIWCACANQIQSIVMDI